MNKIIATAFIVMMMITMSGLGQAIKGSDGLFYDEHGKLFSGISMEFFPDSVIHMEITLNHGQYDGLTRIYYDNGQLEEIRSFKKGLMHGKWESWNRQNVKIAEANYTDNVKDGKWYVWDNNGTLRYDMTYETGKKKGTWFMYDEDGKILSRKDY